MNARPFCLLTSTQQQCVRNNTLTPRLPVQVDEGVQVHIAFFFVSSESGKSFAARF